MTRRKREALRALAERPGTEAEGKLAQEMLERHQPHGIGILEQFLQDGDTHEFLARLREEFPIEKGLPAEIVRTEKP